METEIPQLIEADRQLLQTQMERCGTFMAILGREGFDMFTTDLDVIQMSAAKSIITAVQAETSTDPEKSILKTACDLIAASFYTDAGRMEEILAQNDLDMPTYQDVITTALFIAAHKGYVNVILSLVNAGIGADSIDLRGTTPLHIAAKENHPQCVQLLLLQGASVNHRSRDEGKTPWIEICGLPTHAAVAQILASYGAHKNMLYADGVHALYVAAAEGHVEAVRTMLSRGMILPSRLPFSGVLCTGQPLMAVMK